MEDRRVADYFIVAGLPDEPELLDDFTRDGVHLKPSHDQAPITDIAIIFPSLGELPPAEFSVIETTPTGYLADLNHGSLRSPDVYLCYRRGRDKPPLVDIGVMYEGKERIMSDSEVVLTSPGGRSANVNNSASKIYVTFRRASPTMPCNELVVTDICVILTNKGEIAPHAFCMINKNLNKGMVGSDVFLCYKKSMNRAKLISYKPGILTRYPHYDHENFPFPASVPLFCLPMGASIECWPSKAIQPRPVFSTFVLTVSDAAEKLYGSAVTFYERLAPDVLSAEQLKELEYITGDTEKTLNVNKCICLLSHWPFFDTFEKFLLFLYNMSCSGSHPVPIERYISHFLENVPFPSIHRPRILVQLSATDRVILTQPEDLPLPRSGASFRELLMNLGPENCLMVLLLALTEQKLLIHSLRPDVLTAISEAISMIMYPFKWQCPYIPLCPLGLAEVLHAPLPFLIGVDSRFFDLYDPPTDVNCVDLDTNTITVCEEKKHLSVKLLPKKPARTLKSNLELLSQKIRQFVRSSAHDPGGKDSSIDRDFQIKRKEQCLELEIQDTFLRFTATILKGYRTYLLPITKAPTIGTTDPNSLFNLQGFLRSRDKTYHKFFSLVMKTQMFIRFIEERSFVSDMDAGLAFFDDCTEKVENDETDVRLLELDESHQSERTVFIGPPELSGLPPGITYSYEMFIMNPVLFSRKELRNLITDSTRMSTTLQGSPMARRTKHEIKSAQKLARKFASSPDLWARCLLGTCFSMWFIHLPSYVSTSRSKASACLRKAYDLLVKMQKLKLQPTDEVCYRVMMQLCGVYNQPMLAVKLLSQMKLNGIQPNALTYGFYNRAVLDSAWPCHTSGQQLWNKLRNVVIGAALFRHGVRRPEDSVSFSDAVDGTSHTSIDSGSSHELPEHTRARLKVVAENKPLTNGKSNVVNDLDFRTFDRYRNRHGSIVRPNGVPLLSSQTSLQQQSFESSAGLLMTCQFSGRTIMEEPSDIFSDALSESPTIGSRRHRTRSGSCAEFVFNLRSPGVGPHPTSPKTSRPTEAPISPGENLKQLIRSQSFANDARILDNLNRLKSGVQKDGLTNGLEFAGNGPKPSYIHRGSSSRSLFGRKSNFSVRHSLESSVENLEERSSAGSMDDLDSATNGSPMLRSNSKVLSMFNRFGSGFLENTAFRSSQEVNKQNSSVDSLLSDDISNNVSSTCVKSVANDSEFSKENSLDQTDASDKTVLSAKLSSSSQKTSPIRTPVTQNDPLGALNTNGSETVIANGDIQDSEPTSLSSSCISANTLVQDMPEAAVRPLLFGRGVSRSATFTSAHGDEEDDDLLVDARIGLGKSMQRSSTMPMTVSPSSNTSSGGLGSSIGSTFKLPFSNRFSPARISLRARELRAGTQLIENALANFSPSSLTSKKSNEILQGGLNSLKSAATSVVKKFDEFKEAMSVNSTPVKSNTGSGRAADRDSMYSEGDTADATTADGPSRRVSSEFSPLAVHMHLDYWGNNFLDIFGGEGSRKGSSSNLQPLGSPASSQSQLFTESLYARDASIRDPRAPVALEVSMSTCSKCHNCNCVLYDEEIMAGWVPEDSNLNTKCQFCNKATVPFLTVTVLDYRGQAMVAPADSQESVDGHGRGRNSFCRLSQIGASSTSLDVSNKEPPLLDSLKSNENNTEENVLKPVEETNSEPVTLEPITVPYLNPLVLRKEFENILYSEGDECLTQPQFVDEHPIIYWNLVWVFQRINVVSHLPGLCLEAATINKNQSIHNSWTNCDHNNVSIRILWDNPRLHEEVGQPMYVLWQQNEQHSDLVNALVTERTTLSRVVMQMVISGVRNSDLLEPLKKLAAERQKLKGRGVNRSHSLYRDILFLAFAVMGRDNIDQAAFDREYISAYERLSEADLKLLYKCDRPLSFASLQCRQYFKELDL